MVQEKRKVNKINNLIKIGNQRISVKEYNNQRVVTFKDVDSVHERPEGTARKRFSDNESILLKAKIISKYRRPNFGQRLETWMLGSRTISRFLPNPAI